MIQECPRQVVMLQVPVLHLGILYPACLAPCIAPKIMRLRLHGQEKQGIRIYWNTGPISLNGEEGYDPRFVDFLNFE